MKEISNAKGVSDLQKKRGCLLLSGSPTQNLGPPPPWKSSP